MRIIKITLLLLFLPYLTACISKQGDEFTILTKNVDNTPEFYIDKGTDLGYILLGADTVILTINLYNKSDFPYKNMDLLIDNLETAGMTFREEPDTNEKSFPGFGGTCGATLFPHQKCTIKLQYRPVIEGEFTQKITWSYTNLLEQKNYIAKIHLITATPASLTFTNDNQFYNLGIIERTDITTTRTQTLEIKNTGGFPASNLTFNFNPLSGNSAAFKIIENNCPQQLFRDESCTLTVQYQPQNYQCAEYPSAPDGDIRELEYKTILSIGYEADFSNTVEHLNATFNFISTSIEGYMTFGGNSFFSFNPLIVGNEQTILVAFNNDGYKEAIIRQLHVKKDGVLIANCVYDPTSDFNNHFLTCKNPTTGAALKLEEFPFVIKDNQQCIIDENALDYTRLADLSLSNSTLRLVQGKDITNPLSSGESCTFDLTFHPSVKYIEGQPEDLGKEYWKNLEFTLEFDSTWKNRIVLYNTTTNFVPMFTVEEAFYKYAALLKHRYLTYNGLYIAQSDYATLSDYYLKELPTNPLPTPSNPITYQRFAILDLGNISLVSQSVPEDERDQYRQIIYWGIANESETDAKNIIFQALASTDATTSTTLTKDTILNSYFTVTLNTCLEDLAFGDRCALGMSLLPISGATENMFDQVEGSDATTGNPYGHRRVAALYEDGATYSDERNSDGSFKPRGLQSLELRLKAALVSKGLLTFKDPSSTGDWATDTSKNIITGNATYHDIILKNIGTGAITKLYLNYQGAPNDLAYPSGNAPAPAAAPYVPVPTGNSDDCLKIIDPNDIDLPGYPSSNFTDDDTYYIAADGGTCTLRLKVELPRSPSFLLTGDQYGDRTLRTNLRQLSEALRLDWRGFPNSSDEESVVLSFTYKPDATQSDIKRILSDNLNGVYKISSVFDAASSLYVDRALPQYSAIVYKPSFDVDETEAGGSLVTEPSRNILDLTLLYPPTRYEHFYYLVQHQQTDLNTFSGTTSIFDSTKYEYLVYAGVFAPSTTHNISFRIHRIATGAVSGTIQFDQSYRDDSFQLVTDGGIGDSTAATFSTNTYPSGQTYTLSFSNENAGIYYQDIVIKYTNGTYKADANGLRVEENGLEEYTFVIRVVAEVVDDTSLSQLEFEIADVPVIAGDGTAGTPDDSNLTYESYDLSTKPVIELIDIRGGDELFAQKRIRITNPSSSTVDVEKIIPGLTTSSIPLSQDGLELLNVVCSNGNTLDKLPPGENCTFDIRWTATESSPESRDNIYVNLFTNITPAGENNEEAITQYQLPLAIYSENPAKVTMSGTMVQDIGSDVNVNIVELGLYSDNHIVLDNTTTTDRSQTYVIVNSGSNKASLLKQYELYQAALGNSDPSLPTSEPVKIYSKIEGNSDFDKDIDITANLACMYGTGNDEDTPVDQRGFDNNDSGCEITITFHASPDKFLNSPYINLADYITRIYYYNYQDISYDFFKFTFQGMVEPPQSHEIPGYTNVISTNNNDGTGTISFTVNGAPKVDTDPDLGNVIGYRVFFSGSINNLDNIFNQTAQDANTSGVSPVGLYYVDVDSLDNITLTDLPEKTFYYIKVVPRRSYNGINYVSHNHSQLFPDVLTVPVPAADATYDFTTQTIVDKGLLNDTLCYRDECKNFCLNTIDQYYKNGALRFLQKQLITRKVLDNYILLDPNIDDYNNSTVSNYDVKYTLHWLADDPVDVNNEGFPDTSKDSDVLQVGEDSYKFYLQCDNSDGECEVAFPLLSTMYGYSDPPNLYNSYFFVDRNLFQGYARCYIPAD